MGLLDKASDAGSKSAKKPVAKAVAKAKPVAKAVAKAKPVAKAVAKGKPKAALIPGAVTANAKPVKAMKVGKKSKTLPGNFEIASPNARRIAWFTNTVVNLGPIFAFLFSVAILDAFTTIFAIAALVALTLNLIVVPIMSGRTLGNFVSRTKGITYSGSKPNFLHALFANSTGILALTGVIFLMVNAGTMLSAKGSEQVWASIFSALGLIFLVLFFVNYTMKAGSESNQGLYDNMFGAYLVKHVPAEGEASTGFIGKLESMASYGDRFTQRQEAKSAKKAPQLLSTDESEDEPVAKAVAKAKPSAKAKAKDTSADKKDSGKTK